MKKLIIISLVCLMIQATNIVGSKYTLNDDAIRMGFNHFLLQAFPQQEFDFATSSYFQQYNLRTEFGGFFQSNHLGYYFEHEIINNQFRFIINNRVVNTNVRVTNFFTGYQQTSNSEIIFSLQINLYFNSRGSLQMRDVQISDIIDLDLKIYGFSIINGLKQSALQSFREQLFAKLNYAAVIVNSELLGLPLETLLVTNNVIVNLSFNQEAPQIYNILYQNMMGQQNVQNKGIPSYSNLIPLPEQSSPYNVIFHLSEYTLNTISTILLNDQKFNGVINDLTIPLPIEEALKQSQFASCQFQIQLRLETSPTFQIQDNGAIFIDFEDLIAELRAITPCDQLVSQFHLRGQFLAYVYIFDNIQIKIQVNQGSIVDFNQTVNNLNQVESVHWENYIQSMLQQSFQKINQVYFNDGIPFNMNTFNFSSSYLTFIENHIIVEANF